MCKNAPIPLDLFESIRVRTTSPPITAKTRSNGGDSETQLVVLEGTNGIEVASEVCAKLPLCGFCFSGQAATVDLLENTACGGLRSSELLPTPIHPRDLVANIDLLSWSRLSKFTIRFAPESRLRLTSTCRRVSQ